MKRAAALLAAAALGACGETAQVSDWERNHPELLATPASIAAPPPQPPAYPRRENLVEFYVSPTETFKYFIDASTLGVEYKQREVRFTQVARSPSGVENVTFEAIKCPDLHRIYAVGSDGRWSQRGSDWREMPRTTGVTPQRVLSRQFFCPHRDTIQSAAEGADALRRGAHPLVYVEQRPGPASR